MAGSRQADLQDLHLHAASGKVPPQWGPDTDQNYPLRTYIRDLRLWSYAADVDQIRLAPLACLRLTGQAKELVRELDPQVLAQGRQLQNGNIQSGLEFLIATLEARYGVLQQELQIFVLRELLQFHRRGGESIDEALSRFGILNHKAFEGAGIALDIPVQSWLLLNGLGISPKEWPTVLINTAGALPADMIQYTELCNFLKRRGHLVEGGGNHIDPAKQFQSGRQAQSYFIGDGQDNNQAPVHHWDQVYPTFGSSGGNTYAAYDYDDGISEASSGNSNDDDPVNFDDVKDLDHQAALEHIYLLYRQHKRRWRRFQGQGRRRRKFYRKGKGKGKGRRNFGGKGWQGHQGYMTDMTHIPDSQATIVDTTWPDSPQVYVCAPETLNLPEPQHVFFKGSGGKGSGKGMRRAGNPLGRDGNPLQCSICQSTEHLRAHCPQRGAASTSSSSGKGSSSKGSYPVSQVTPVSSNNTQVWPLYFMNEKAESKEPQPEWTDQTVYEFFIDGAVERVVDDNSTLNNNETSEQAEPRKPKYLAFPFWPQMIYHAKVRLPGRESLLIDVGAPYSLCGSEWAERVKKEGEAAGRGTVFKELKEEVGLEGVGKESSAAKTEGILPIKLEAGDEGEYRALIVPGSLPALLGLSPIEKMKGIICTATRRLILPGPGGYKIMLSPGSKIHQLYKSDSGHLMLPCCEWKSATMKSHEKMIRF